MSDNLYNNALQNLIEENSTVLNEIRERAGTLPRSALVDFVCEMPDKASALAARQQLLEHLPPNNDRQIYAMSTDEEVECIVEEIISISAEAISEIELAILEVCQKHGGKEVHWGFLEE